MAGTEGGVKEDNDDVAVDSNEKQDESQEAAKLQGQYMYLGLLSYFYTGGYRLLPAKDFRYEIIIGYGVEVITLIIPFLIC